MSHILGFIFLSLIGLQSLSQTPSEPTVPKVNFSFWNTGNGLQYDNNCYNYATNRVTDSFAQPGEASGKIYDRITCKAVYAAASQDLGLTQTSFFPYTKKNDSTLIALVVYESYDFHWYRRDDNGLWTHKMGDTRATNLDNNSQVITDPEKADRGNYTEFCGYFSVKSFPKNKSEQNAGQVRIGNMTSFPDKNTKSYAELLMYSGRRNPRVHLADLLTDKMISEKLNLLKDSFTKNSKLLATSSVPDDFQKLGYNGIHINDINGLIYPAGTRISIKDQNLFLQTPENKNYLLQLDSSGENIESLIKKYISDRS